MIYIIDSFRYSTEVNEITFCVEGQPRPKQRPRQGRNGRFYTPKDTRDYENLVKECATKAMINREPLEGDLYVSLVFHRATRRRADLDNLGKAVLDAMNEIVYHDDKQIVEKYSKVHLQAENPRVEIRVKIAS